MRRIPRPEQSGTSLYSRLQALYRRANARLEQGKPSVKLAGLCVKRYVDKSSTPGIPRLKKLDGALEDVNLLLPMLVGLGRCVTRAPGASNRQRGPRAEAAHLGVGDLKALATSWEAEGGAGVRKAPSSRRGGGGSTTSVSSKSGAAGRGLLLCTCRWGTGSNAGGSAGGAEHKPQEQHGDVGRQGVDTARDFRLRQFKSLKKHPEVLTK